jgi:Holliday junction resolvase RusA-like endonuclease
MIIPVTPIPKPRMTRADSWKKRPIVTRYWKYKDELSEYDIQLNNPLSVTFVLPLPKSWSKKKKEEYHGKPHESKPDLDNLIKALQDCVLVEDSHIHTYLNCRKIWGYEGSIIIDTDRD